MSWSELPEVKGGLHHGQNRSMTNRTKNCVCGTSKWMISNIYI